MLVINNKKHIFVDNKQRYNENQEAGSFSKTSKNP